MADWRWQTFVMAIDDVNKSVRTMHDARAGPREKRARFLSHRTTSPTMY